jgi:hypothetical protein
MPVNEGLAYNASRAARGSPLSLVVEGICAELAPFLRRFQRRWNESD